MNLLFAPGYTRERTGGIESLIDVHLLDRIARSIFSIHSAASYLASVHRVLLLSDHHYPIVPTLQRQNHQARLSDAHALHGVSLLQHCSP